MYGAPQFRGPPTPGTRVRQRGCAIAAVLVALLWTPVTRAGEVVIVTSGDAGPYAQAEAGLKTPLAENKRSTRTLSLQEVSKKGLNATIGNNADLVVAVGTPAAVWLHDQLPAATPLVYCMVADPASAGLTEGRAAYGVSTDVPLKAQFALIAEALPKARTLGLLYHANTPESQRQLKIIQGALPKEWQLKAIAVDQSASIADAIESLLKQHVDAVWTSPDPTIYDTASVRALLLASLRTGTPVFGFSASFVKAGALLGIGVDPQAQGRQAAALALYLLGRASAPATAPVNPPDTFQIAVNLIVAGQFNVQLPQALVQRAAYVYKEDR